jgi:hypothetical protein
MLPDKMQDALDLLLVLDAEVDIDAMPYQGKHDEPCNTGLIPNAVYNDIHILTCFLQDFMCVAKPSKHDIIFATRSKDLDSKICQTFILVLN